jgi:hypothetical protein
MTSSDASQPTDESAVKASSQTLFPPEFSSWTSCRQQAWLQLEANPNCFFYRHVMPGEIQRTGPWTDEENALFIETLRDHPPDPGQWGLFSRLIPSRVGYQCNAQYKKLRAAGLIPTDGPPSPSNEEPKSIPSPPPTPKPNVCAPVRMEYADRCQLNEVHSFHFVPTSPTKSPTFGARLRENMKDPVYRATFLSALGPVSFR